MPATGLTQLSEMNFPLRCAREFQRLALRGPVEPAPRRAAPRLGLRRSRSDRCAAPSLVPPTTCMGAHVILSCRRSARVRHHAPHSALQIILSLSLLSYLPLCCQAARHQGSGGRGAHTAPTTDRPAAACAVGRHKNRPRRLGMYIAPILVLAALRHAWHAVAASQAARLAGCSGRPPLHVAAAGCHRCKLPPLQATAPRPAAAALRRAARGSTSVCRRSR